MYIPAHFAGGDEDEIAAFVEQAGSADLVTFDGSKLIATLMPVIWDRSAGEHPEGQPEAASRESRWMNAPRNLLKLQSDVVQVVVSVGQFGL